MKDDPFKEEILVRYLLGDLPEEEQSEIEDRAFQDEQRLRELLAAESDLIDEYVRGELSVPARRKFEGRFLASAERRRKVEFARALATVTTEFAVAGKDARSAAISAPVTWQSAVAAFLRGLDPVARYSMAAAALLIVIGGSLLVIETLRLRAQVARLQAEQTAHEQREQSLEEQLAEQRQRSQELANGLQREQQQRERNQELIRELEREREESGALPSQSAVVSLALWPGISRGGGARPRLVLPRSTRTVRLQVGVEPGDEYPGFRAELRAPGGQTVWTQDDLSARQVRAGRAVILNLPASILRAGEYELALKGVTAEGKTLDVGYHYFDVLMK
jgi:hypothetical protein